MNYGHTILYSLSSKWEIPKGPTINEDDYRFHRLLKLGLVDKIFSLASDGASVMMRNKSDVATRLSQETSIWL
ncbi:18674_t:CDS:2 [Entrophospora sp. SA101]|nr:18674_t:CDS:2 [Entrophospora sp. SA101]